jgi:serine phosphatase RsbU (regulator of sigma subunit)
VFLLALDPASGSAEYVRAGHPPALLRLPDGRVQELSGSGTPPVGIFDQLHCRSHSVEVPPGSMLLLYTDGLIERRGESLEVGLERLKQLFAKAPDDPELCLQSLAGDLGADAIPDDVAMLAVATGRRNG